MNGEGALVDCKRSYDSSNPAARLEMVKNLVAMANAGGGEISTRWRGS